MLHLDGKILKKHLAGQKVRKLCVWFVTHLNISNEELCWCFHRCFGVNDLLYGTGPVHSLIEVLGIQPVAVLPSIYCDAPVA